MVLKSRFTTRVLNLAFDFSAKMVKLASALARIAQGLVRAMYTTAVRLVLGAAVGVALLGGAVIGAGRAEAQGCDPSYPQVCISPSPLVTCAQIGFPIVVIHDATIGAFDPHGLDLDFNGIGCG